MDCVAAEPVDFNTEIRPILSNNCFFCHGPDEEERQAGLRLDSEAGAFEDLGGYAAIVSGKPEESELFKRIISDDPDVVMPPPERAKKLKPNEIAIIKQWISEGGKFAEHWAYVVPKSTAVPDVSGLPEPARSWPRGEIDRFLLKRMHQEGLSPTAVADRQALIRRVTLDLTGLPPTLEDVDSFAADESPDAFEQLVDRLLASEAYGEHMARMWLDLARYADSAGYADDPARTIWGYRDYVIRSFNANKPFDQFTIEQLAGDLLPEPTDEQLVATAFHRNTLTNNEGGTNDEEFRNVAVVDRVNTTMAVWMGTTMACAQCHTHKYDPITQQEYFEFFAFFNNSADADRRDESPLISIYTDEQHQQEQLWREEVTKLESVTKSSTPELLAARDTWSAELSKPLDWKTVVPQSATSAEKSVLRVEKDGTVVADSSPTSDTYTLTFPSEEKDRTLTGLRLETFPTGNNFVITRMHASIVPPNGTSLPGQFVRIELPGDNQMLSLAEVQVFSEGSNAALIGTATQSSTDFGGPPELAIDGNTNGDYRAAKSTTHTAQSKDPWWEVDLKEVKSLDQIVLWNRTDSKLQTRLDNFIIKVLDADRQVVWEEKVAEAPKLNKEFALSGIRHIPFTSALADHSQDKFPAEAVLVKVSEPGKGWAVSPQQDQPHQLTLLPSKVVAIPAGSALTVTIDQRSQYENHTLGQFRLSLVDDPRAADLAPLPADVLVILATQTDARTEPQNQRLTDYYLTIAPALAPQRTRLAEVNKALAESKPTTTVPVMRDLAEDKHRVTKMQMRGNWLDQTEVVHEGVPAAFNPLPDDVQRNRLALAQWVMADDNPLTARVIVNRFWEKLFGIGIVRTSEEFGSQGELPSHPALLDWLAVDFRDNDWNVKRLLKQMVMSAAYQQSSRVSQELLDLDPDNRLLARGPRFRLSAEMVRDQALAIAGLLSHKMYGPPVRPPQPSMGLSAAFGSSTDWQTSMGEDRYRRGIYVTWRRSNPYPSMAAFDAPNREVCTLKRDRTNTPLQAFVTLNDPVYVEAAQGLSRRMHAHEGSIEAKIIYGFRLCVAREPTSKELKRLTELFHATKSQFDTNPAQAEKLATDPIGPIPEGSDPVELAAWTLTSNVLLNLDEVLMKR